MKNYTGVLVMALWLGSVPTAHAAGRVVYADSVFYNGKIVTLDDHSFSSSPGNIAQALAIKDGKLWAIGSNAEVRDLAGPDTKSVDLNGRTVLPTFIDTHEHPADWDPLNPYIMKKVVPEDFALQGWLEGPADQQVQQFPRLLDELVQKAKPGQWIRIVFLYGEDYQHEGDAYTGPFTNIFTKRITKQQLDRAAPNNPVMLRNSFTGTLYNQKALDEFHKVYPDFSKLLWSGRPNEQTGEGALTYRQAEADVMFKDRLDLWMEILRLGLSWSAGDGITTIGTLLHSFNTLMAYKTLEKRGEMDSRIAWGYGLNPTVTKEVFQYPYIVADLVMRDGEGSDYMWYYGTGAAGSAGSSCSTFRAVNPEVAEQEANCKPNLAPGTLQAENLYTFSRMGGRVMGYHMMGDIDVDNLIEIITRASRDAGFTLDQIRAKRHTWDHGFLSPRRDQAERAKDLGMIAGNRLIDIWNLSPRYFRDYGERAVQFISPAKMQNDIGMMNTFEVDRSLALAGVNAFWYLWLQLKRESMDGRVYAPNQAMDRVRLLKSVSLWGAYYALKEDAIGSLETNKLADFTVLDKDYLTAPVDEVRNIRILMTVVGGKIVHLVPSLARELGMQPAGAQVALGGPAAQW